MNILMLHNRYQFSGGEDVIVKQEKELLEKHGHKVFLLEKNNKEIKSLIDKLLVGFKTINSYKAKKIVSLEIDKVKPDIIHVHNFFPLLSPSVYQAAKEKGLPVVQALHNYRLVCPNALLFRAGCLCERCIGLKFPYYSLVYGCYRQSRINTLPVALMLAWHNVFKTWHRYVDAFIALSSFQKAKLELGGLPTDKIFVKPNFLKTSVALSIRQRQNFALFVGRLSEEKGVMLLVKAYKESGLTFPLKIVGNGPLAAKVKAAAKLLPIEIIGEKSKKDILVLMKQAKVLVAPSIWVEVLPMVIVEALASSLPVITFANNSFSEYIKDQNCGWLVKERNSFSLAKTLNLVAHLTEQDLQSYRRQAKKTYLKYFTPEKNYQQLMAIYEYAKQSAGC